MKGEIIFLGGARRVTLLEKFKQISEQNNIDVEFTSIERDEGFYPISAYANVIVGPKFSSKEFDTYLDEQYGHRSNILIIACMDAAVPALSKFYEKKNGLLGRAFSPTISGANIALDKMLTSDFCMEHKINHPKSLIFTSSYKGKVIAKPKQGFGGKGIHFFDMISSVPEILFETHIVQQYVNGPETTHDVYIYANGEFDSSSRDRLAVIDGEVDHCIVRQSTNAEKEIFSCIAKTGLFYGPITVQTINSDGVVFLIEINSRLGGGVTASIEAGYPAVELMLEYAFGISIHRREFRSLEMKRARRDFYKFLA